MRLYAWTAVNFRGQRRVLTRPRFFFATRPMVYDDSGEAASIPESTRAMIAGRMDKRVELVELGDVVRVVQRAL